MKSGSVVAFFCLASVVTIASGAVLPLPDFIKPCSRNDPKLNECAVKQGPVVIPKVKDGNRKYRIPKLEPLRVDQIKVDQDQSAAVGFNLIAKDINIHGISQTELKDMEIQVDPPVFKMKFFIPRVELLAKYIIDGKVLILPIQGKGDANITMVNLVLDWGFDADWVKKENGVQYMKMKNHHINYDMARNYIKLDNLFNGNKALGNTFTICKTKDKDFQECFKKSAEKALNAVLSDGIPEWGMVSLDPLFVPQLIISTGDGPVGLTLKFDNATHTGMRSGRMMSAKADPKNYKFDFEFKLPHYTVAGPYEARGRIILLPITGKGFSNFTYHDVDVKWHIEGKPHTNAKGKTFMEPVKFDVIIHSERASIDMTNLFNGDKTLGDNMLKFLNENQEDFLSEMEPALNHAFSKLFLALAKQLFKKLPYNEMFPDL